MCGVTEEIKGNCDGRAYTYYGAIADIRKAGNNNEIRYEVHGSNDGNCGSFECSDAGGSCCGGRKTAGDDVEL